MVGTCTAGLVESVYNGDRTTGRFESWKGQGWNTTIDRLEGTIAKDEVVKVYAKLQPGRTFPVTVSELEPPRKMVWTGGMPFGLFKGQRTFTVTPSDEGAVTFTMDEVFSGPLSALIGRSIPDMQPSFEEFAACLKAAAEA